MSDATIEIPWYLEDFAYAGIPVDQADERALYAEWADIDPEDEDRAEERWDLFWEISKSSPAFFIHEAKLPIRTKIGSKIPFDAWNPSQRLVYKAFLSEWQAGQPVRLIVLKARQVGLSTLSAALMFWRTIVFADTSTVVMCDKTSHSEHIRSMVGIFLAHLEDTMPQRFVPQVAQATKGAIIFGRKRRDHQKTERDKGQVRPILDSAYRCMTAASSISERSWTIQALHASEVCFWKNAEEHWLGLSQAIPDVQGSIVILETSADAAQDFFRNMWDSAEAGESTYVPIFAGWQIHDEYRRPIPAKYTPQTYAETYDKDELRLVQSLGLTPEQVEWRRQQIRDKCNNDPRMFRQEYPSSAAEAWVSQGHGCFAPEALRAYQEGIDKERRKHPDIGEFVLDESGLPVWIPREDGHCTIWRHPEAGRTYCLGVDPAEGGGNYTNFADSSCVQVLDAESLEQVATYSSSIISPERLAEQVVAIGRYYAEALIVPEANAVGGTLIFHLGSLEAEPMYFRPLSDGGYAGIKGTVKAGVYTTARNKGPQLIRRLEELINGEKLVLHDRRTIKQLAAYERHQDGSYGAGKKGHDDSVMALALCLHGIHSDQLIWHRDDAMGLRRAGDLLRDARELVEAGKLNEVHPQLQGYFAPQGTSPWDY